MRPAALALCLFLSACGFIRGGPSEKPPPLPAFTPSLKVKVLWRAQVGEGAHEPFLRLAPAAEGGRVFAADSKGLVEARDGRSGALLWKTKVPAPISGGVGSGEGQVLVASPEGEVIALDGDDGSLLWRTPIAGEVLSPPGLAEGVAVVHASDGRIVALDALDGHILWQYRGAVPPLTLRGTSPPLLVEGRAVAGLASGRLVCLDLHGGRVLWEVALAPPGGATEIERLKDIDGRMAYSHGIVYAVGYQGRVAAVALETGEVLWSRAMSSYSGLAVDGDKVYVSDADGIVWALERRTGAPFWRQEGLKRRSLTAPAVHQGAVAVGDGEGYVHWLSPEDGRFLARTRIDSKGLFAPMAVSGPILYAYGRGGVLAALALP